MKLPLVSGMDMVKLLGKVCFRLERQKGSHMFLNHADAFKPVTVPNHAKIKRGTLCAILKQAGLSRDEFLDLYYRR